MRPSHHVLAAAVLVGLALVTRLAWLDLAEFHYDEAANMLYTLETPGLPLLGRASDLLNTPTPPHTFYLYGLIAMFSVSPVAWTGVIAVVNAVGVGLLYLLGTRMIDTRVAAIGAVLYAVNPYAVLFSRKIWEPEWVAPFFIGALLLGWLGLVEGRRWAQAAALPVFALVPLLHLSALPLLAVVPVLLWLGRVRLRWWWLALGAGIAGMVMLPFVVGLITQMLPNGGARVREAVRPTASALAMLADFALGWRYDLRFAPFQTAALLGPLAPVRYVWVGIGGVLVVAGLVRAVRDREAVLLVWVFTSAIVLSVGVITPYPRYLLGAIPAVCLMMGLGADMLLRWRPGRAVVWGAVGVLAVLHVGAWGRMLHYGARVATPFGYTVPLRAWLDARAEVPPGAVVLVTPAGSDGVVHETIWRALLWERADCVTAVSSRDVPLLAEPYTVLVTPGGAAHPLLSRGPAAQLALRPGDPAYVRYRSVSPFDVPQAVAIAPAVYENGVAWTGYAPDGERLWVRWQFPESGTGPDVAAYLRGYDAAGVQVADVLVDLPPTWGWCGQVMLTAVELPELASAASVGVALVARPLTPDSPRYLAVVDEAGLPMVLEAVRELRAG